MSRVVKNIIGMNFGMLTVVEYAYKKDHRHFWRCLCECGNTKVVLSKYLGTSTTSCGCKRSACRREDLKGKVFHRLTVVDFNSVVNNGKRNIVYWNCLCECGNVKRISSKELKHGTTKSCGCYQRELKIKHGMCKDRKTYQQHMRKTRPIRRLRDAISCGINRMLKIKHIKKSSGIFKYLPYTPYELKSYLESMWEPWMNWDNYGGAMNDKRKTWHIDHIKPHSLFNYSSLEDKEFLECWSLSNLRPLDKIENVRKSNKLELL